MKQADLMNRIEIARNILHNAARMNASKEILLRISKIIDKYIIEYYTGSKSRL